MYSKFETACDFQERINVIFNVAPQIKKSNYQRSRDILKSKSSFFLNCIEIVDGLKKINDEFFAIKSVINKIKLIFE